MCPGALGQARSIHHEHHGRARWPVKRPVAALNVAVAARVSAALAAECTGCSVKARPTSQAGLRADEADSGAVALIQRFGSAANLNIHLHCLVLDGVYRRGADGEPVFVEVPAPTDEALQAVLHKIITRMMKLLTRRGALVEEQASTYMADNDGDSDEARTLRPLQATALHLARGPAKRC